MRACALASAIIATLSLTSATGASAHGRSTVTDDERRLRAQETSVLGSAHAADHARQRALLRDPAARRRIERRRKGVHAGAPTARAAAVPSEDGQWAPPFDIPAIGIHASLLPTGKVLWFYRTAEDVERGQATLWDPATGAFKQVPPPLIDGKPANIFCAGQSLLPDGRLLVMGGQLGDNPDSGAQFKGLDAVFTFNPHNETWTRQPNMSGGRWYPTQVLLPDGRTVVMGGYDASGVVGAPHNPDIEVFTPSPDLDGVGTVTVVGKRGGTGNPPTGGLYPHLFSMPSGRTLVAGPRPSDSWFLNPLGSGPLSWSNVADPVNHAFGTGVILPSASAESATKVALIAGGLEAGTHVQVFDETAPGTGWTTAPALNVPRSHHNTVLLPDGSMVTVGGGRGNVNNDKSLFLPENLSVELYDPATGTWRQGPSQGEGRAYHSTALLLPDGRVVSAGDDTNGGNSTDTAEIYSPPYLFKGARPAVTGAPARVGYGQDFTATFGGSDVASAVLVAPGATTHAVDMSQRYVPLQITGRTDDSVTLAAPAKAELAPPGHYMLFLLNAKGVPSVARYIKLGGGSSTPPPDPDPDPDPDPVPAESAADAFGRTVVGGWGSADAGGAWTVSAPSAFGVGSGVGSVAVPGGAVQRLAMLESVSARDVDLRVDSAFGSLGTSGAHLQYLVARKQASGAYLRVGLMASGGKLVIRGQSSTGASLFADTDTGLGFTAGAAYRLRVQLEGASPTTIRARAWKVGTSEPAAWNVVAASTSGPQVAGAIGLRQLTTAHTATTITADNLTAEPLSP